MAFDYADLLATARELLAEFGKQVTFIKYDLVPADSSKPWLGSTAPRGTGATSTVWAVPIPPSSAEELGIDTDDTRQDDGYQRRVDQVLIAEPGTDVPDDLDTYNEARIEGEVYGVVRASKLKPGDTTLLYFFWVKR